MIFSCPAKVFPKLISFSFLAGPVLISTYFAEDGMTFVDWVSSQYNTDGYKLVNSPPNKFPPPIDVPPPYLVTKGEERILLMDANVVISGGAEYDLEWCG